MTKKTIVLWAAYTNCMDLMLIRKCSTAEQDGLIRIANKMLDKWFVAVEAERKDECLREG